MSDIRLRPRHTLPATELSWLTLSDHFVATVGPRAGEGRPLGPLLVLADATFAPQSRFPLHPHGDMEILSIVVDGELSHHGDQAHGAVVKAREAVLISARDGIVHAEGNVTDRPTHMLQIWFRPNALGGAPAYHQRTLPPTGEGLHLVAGDAVMPMRCDARVWWLDLRSRHALAVAAGRTGYLLALSAPLRVGGGTLAAGDGAEVGAGECVVEADGAGSAVWIDVAV